MLAKVAPTLTVSPMDALIDVPRLVVVTGASPGALLTLRTRTVRSGGQVWRSEAHFRADETGRIDLTRDAPVADPASAATSFVVPKVPVSGERSKASESTSTTTGAGNRPYSGVSAMGLLWSQCPDKVGVRDVFPDRVDQPLTTVIEVVDGSGTLLADATMIQRLMGPGVSRTDMRADGCVGTLFTPATPTPTPTSTRHPVILVLNGSGGGINEPRAALYASHGYAALALGYFKTPGLSDYISNTPLEYFKKALDWITTALTPRDGLIVVSGQSRGGELALLLGAVYPERVKGVIGYVPAAVVHSAQNAADPATGREGPTWLLDGQPLPHLWENNRTASWRPFDEGPPPHRHERAIRTALQDADAVARARIRVENIDGPVLLLSASDDGSWPSSDYSRMVVEHARAARHLDFEGAGHAIVFPYVPTTQLVYAHPVSGRISTGGGRPDANAQADETSWQAVLEFLAAAVRTRANPPDSVNSGTPTL